MSSLNADCYIQASLKCFKTIFEIKLYEVIFLYLWMKCADILIRNPEKGRVFRSLNSDVLVKMFYQNLDNLN